MSRGIRRETPRRRRALFAILLAVLTAIAPQIAAKAGDRAVVLPTTGIIGAVRRDEAGRIVPADSKPATAPGTQTAPADAATSPLAPPLVRFTPDRAKRSALAQRLQRDIQRIIHNARAAKAYGAPTDAQGLTMPERGLIEALHRRDRAVRGHEMRHFYAGRPYTLTPEYWYVSGPRHRRYAVTGVVQMDLREVPGDRHATMRKLERLKNAMLAPLQPSAEDRAAAQTIDRALQRLRARGE